MKTSMCAAVAFLILSVCSSGLAQTPEKKEKKLELDTVVVTANRTKESLRDVSQNITIFTAEDIEQSGAQSVPELLKKAGIQVFSQGSDGYGNEGVVIRGGRSSMHGFDIAGDVLVLVDGHRAGSDFLGNISLESTERIEVIRGPGAVQYGSAAMGGVINVISKKGGEKSQGFVSAGMGSWDEHRYKAGVSGQNGPVDFAVSASYYSRDNYTLGNGEDYENSDVEDRVRYQLNAGWNFDENNRAGIIVQGTDTREAGKGDDAARSYSYHTRQSRSNYALDLSYEGSTADQETAWLARYFFGKVDYDLKRFTSTSTTQLPLSENRNDFQGSQLQVSREFGRFHGVTGVDWMSYEFDQRQDGDAASSATQNTAQSDFDNIGGFLMGELHLLDKENLTLSAGVRYDTFDVFVDAHKISDDVTISRDVDKTAWTPSVGVAFSPVDWLKLRSSYAKAFKMPLPRQLTGYTIMMRTPFVGNPDLEPEKSDNFDLGFDLDFDLDYGSLFFSSTWFYSKYEDMIGYDTRSADAYYSGTHYWYYNVDEAEIQGIELGVKWEMARLLGLNASLEPYVYWTHLLVFEDSNGYRLPNRSDDTLSTGVTFASDELGLTACVDITYYGTQYASDTVSGSSETVSDYKLEDVGDAWVVDVNMTKRLYDFDGKGDVNLKGSVRNLFDEYYASDEDSWMPGRSFYLGVEYRF